MKPVLLTILLSLLFHFSIIAQTAWGYACGSQQSGPYQSGTMYDIDLATGAGTNLGPACGGSGPSLYAGEFIGGVFFALDNNGPQLITVAADGSCTFVANVTGVSAGHTLTGLSHDVSTGTTYALSTNLIASHLYIINIATGALTLVGSIPGVDAAITLFIDQAGNAYVIEIDPNVAGKVYGIDLSTAAITIPGIPITDGINPIPLNNAQDTDFDCDGSGMATGVLYNGSSFSRLGKLDPLTGVFTQIADLGQEICAFSINCCIPAIYHYPAGSGHGEDQAPGICGEPWMNGDNGGCGFLPWILTTTGPAPEAGHFICTSTNNGDGDSNGDGDIDGGNGVAWGMFANNGQLAEAIRPFEQPLATGDTFRVQIDNGFVNPGGMVAMALQNAAGENLWEMVYLGGASTYTIFNPVNPPINFVLSTDHDEGLVISFTPNGPGTYFARFEEVTPGDVLNLSGNLILPPSGDQAIDRVIFVNANAGPGPNVTDFFVNHLSIGEPVPGCPSDKSAFTSPGTCTAEVLLECVGADGPCETASVAFRYRMNDGINPPGPWSGYQTDRNITLGAGRWEIQWRAVDCSVCEEFCSYFYEILDGEAPVANCKDATVYLDAGLQAVVEPVDVDDNSTDNCGITDWSVNPPSFGCQDLGVNTVTLTVTDAAGNADDCTALVTVANNPAAGGLCCLDGITDNHFIDRVQEYMGGVDNPSGDNGGYQDFTYLTFTVANPYFPYLYFLFTPGNVLASDMQNWELYIDWNKNGEFEPSEKVMDYCTSIPFSRFLNMAGHAPDLYRMRLVMQSDTDNDGCQPGELPNPLCGSIGDGEVEDYTLEIASLTQQQPQFQTQNQLRIFPNPVSDEFYLTLSGPFEVEVEVDIEVVSVSGRSITHQSRFYTGEPLRMDASTLLSGTYFVRVNTGNEILVKTFVRQ